GADRTLTGLIHVGDDAKNEDFVHAALQHRVQTLDSSTGMKTNKPPGGQRLLSPRWFVCARKPGLLALDGADVGAVHAELGQVLVVEADQAAHGHVAAHVRVVLGQVRHGVLDLRAEEEPVPLDLGRLLALLVHGGVPPFSACGPRRCRSRIVYTRGLFPRSYRMPRPFTPVWPSTCVTGAKFATARFRPTLVLICGAT